MDKKDVARGLEEIAGFLELKGENPFRIRAYRTAARTIATFPGELGTALASGALAEAKGVGPAILEIVGELVTTGRSRVLEDLRDEVPPGLGEMLQSSGLGVTKVRQIHETLHVETLAELEEAARDGRLAKLPRFGKKTTENILKGIDFLRQSTGFRLFHHARTEATALAEVLRTMPGVRRVAVAGSVRRRAEIIRDLDFVVELGLRADPGDRRRRAPRAAGRAGPTARPGLGRRPRRMRRGRGVPGAGPGPDPGRTAGGTGRNRSGCRRQVAGAGGAIRSRGFPPLPHQLLGRRQHGGRVGRRLPRRGLPLRGAHGPLEVRGVRRRSPGRRHPAPTR
ncbi:MAG: hypothetical protein HYT81_08875 [Gemmatimonadetes bacterium]|nr:hypothetical protein [Gemmatimonadota bacterium]